MKLCGFDVGLDRPFFLIAGPCVVESEQLQMDVAGRLKEICELGIPFIFKRLSYDKANRSSGSPSAARAWSAAWRSWPRCGASSACPS
jgi:2-dehydro-3-deoxyphosphooctonate aldolase (KDO 8-P synthase)